MLRNLVLLILCLFLFSSLACAEPTKKYPTGWTWSSYDIAYVLSEYDKYAPSPGCKEWLDKTGYSRTTHGTHDFHELPGCWVFISGAKAASWVVETDFTKPVPGAIAYWDKNAATPEYTFILNIVRSIDDNVVTLEAMDNKGIVVTKKIKMEDMQLQRGLMFKGYIYPQKITN